MPASKKKIPIYLTYFRAVGGLLLALSAIQNFDPVCGSALYAGLFLLLACTDFLDGFLARFWKVESRWGSIADPLADKILCNASLLVFCWHHVMPFHCALILIMRDFVVGSLREFAIEKKIAIMPSKLAKTKTALLMFGIPYVYAFPCAFTSIGAGGYPLFPALIWGFAICSSIQSAAEYVGAVRKYID